MDIRSTFRNYLLFVITMGGRRRLRAHDWTCGFRHVGGSSGKSGGSHSLRCHVEGLRTRKAGDAMLPRKASKEKWSTVTRKPTQVGEEKILRRE